MRTIGKQNSRGTFSQKNKRNENSLISIFLWHQRSREKKFQRVTGNLATCSSSPENIPSNAGEDELIRAVENIVG